MSEELDEKEALFLNEALRSYVDTFPREQNLVNFLEARGMGLRMGSVKEALDVSVKAAASYLHQEAGRIKWTSRFEKKLFIHIQETSPWLSPWGFEVLKNYSGWLCWHDGL